MTEPAKVGPFDGSDAEWDGFVAAHPEGRFCARTAYLEAVHAAYGFPARRFAIRREGRVVGVLAASACRSLLFGRKWVSVPYGEYGGFLIAPGADAGDVSRLVQAVGDGARRERAGHFELNGLLGLPEAAAGEFVAAVRYEVAVLDLAPGPDALLEKLFKYEVRKAIRKAERAGLTTREASDPDTIRDVFYPLWLDNMRRLGSPPHGVAYFLELKARFGAEFGIEWTERQGKPVAALVGIRSGARVQVFATASRTEDWQDRPNDLAYWGYIRRACEAGAKTFDFGSVRYEGQRHYKEKWAAVFQPAAHWMLPLWGEGAARTFDSSSATMETASNLWTRYVPGAVARRLGPVIRGLLLR